jgi:hypothetical protein
MIPLTAIEQQIAVFTTWLRPSTGQYYHVDDYRVDSEGNYTLLLLKNIHTGKTQDVAVELFVKWVHEGKMKFQSKSDRR